MLTEFEVNLKKIFKIAPFHYAYKGKGKKGKGQKRKSAKGY